MSQITIERERATRPATGPRPVAPAEFAALVEWAYRLLHVGFVVAPLIAGLDKFTNRLANWTTYLSPRVADLFNANPQTFMRVVGVVEIAAALLVAVAPRIGGFVVSIWLLAIIGNLAAIPGHYDVMLRDMGLAIGAFALGLLALAHWRAEAPGPRAPEMR